MDRKQMDSFRSMFKIFYIHNLNTKFSHKLFNKIWTINEEHQNKNNTISNESKMKPLI